MFLLISRDTSVGSALCTVTPRLLSTTELCEATPGLLCRNPQCSFSAEVATVLSATGPLTTAETLPPKPPWALLKGTDTTSILLLGQAFLPVPNMRREPKQTAQKLPEWLHLQLLFARGSCPMVMGFLLARMRVMSLHLPGLWLSGCICSRS